MDEIPLLTSLSNPLIKQARALRRRKDRHESGLFLVEGLAHVGAAIESGWDVDTLLYAPELLTGDFALTLLDNARRIGVKPQPVSAQIMDSLAEKENPQGILALVRQRNIRFADLPPIKRGAALVSPQDPGNVGTILRTLDAIEIDVLFLLDGGVDLYHPTLVRASMGVLFWKPVVQASFDEFSRWVKKQNLRVIGTSSRAQTDYLEVQVDGAPWVLLLGNEQKGLAPEQLAACDLTISLPMRGKVSSLNLSVAAGILLYALASGG